MGEEIFQLFLAVIVGAIIGSERQIRVGQGVRTLSLICLGATLFTIYSDIFTDESFDPTRIASAVVTGVGFLGAGMILRHRGATVGLTTAASVWLVAALGMGLGIGEYVLVGVGTVLVLFVLWVIPRIRRLTQTRETYTYETISPADEQKFEALSRLFEKQKLQVIDSSVSKKAGQMDCVWRVYGTPERHEHMKRELLTDSDLEEVNVR
jgi:putative Mg2+ transporter-C (MgtC) family protein